MVLLKVTEHTGWSFYEGMSRGGNMLLCFAEPEILLTSLRAVSCLGYNFRLKLSKHLQE